MSCDRSRQQSRTLIELLRWRASHQPDGQAFIFLVDGESTEAKVSYGALDRRARAIGAALQARGAAGERALILAPSALDFISAFFGCLYAGVIAVPAVPPRPNRPMPRLETIAKDARAKFALTTQDAMAELGKRFAHIPWLRSLCWLTTDRLEGGSAEDWRAPEVGPDTLAYLQYTSGSTALPKGVMVSHGNLLCNARMIEAAFQLPEHALAVGWLPLYHDMGLVGSVVEPLYVGAPCVLMSPLAFLQRPFRWLHAISRYKAHSSGGPNFAYDLCVRKIKPEQREMLDLSQWALAYNGSEPVRATTLEEFARTFKSCGFRREAFSPCYGLAEATLLVSGRRCRAGPVVKAFDAAALARGRVVEAAPGDRGARRLVSCGHPSAGGRIAIVAADSRAPCPRDRVGEIWVSGGNVGCGYWKQPKETEETFRAVLARTGEGPFLRTGDLGFLKGGELFVAGRRKDMIIIAGRNHYPQDIELSVERSHPVLKPNGSAAFSVEFDGEERLVVVAEVDRRLRSGEGNSPAPSDGGQPQALDFEEIVKAIRSAVARDHELGIHEVLLVNPGTIPKASSGKVQRYACRERFLAGTLNEHKRTSPRRPFPRPGFAIAAQAELGRGTGNSASES